MTRSKYVDSKKIEKAAVLAIMNLIQPCETIDYKFTEDDKNMLVDGALELYSSSQLSKQNLNGEIDVQIKGTLSRIRLNNRGFAKFPVSIVDLKKYREVFHGVLFFVVLVDSSHGYAIGKQVFYAQLLPYDINRILDETQTDQKSVKIKFKPFPSAPHEILRLVSAFHSDQEKQRRTTVSGYGFMDKNRELPPNIKSFSFSTHLLPGEDITSLAAFRNGAYIYGEDDEGQSLVFGKVDDVCMFAMGHEATVESGNYKDTTMVFSGEHEDGKYLEFEGVNFIIRDSDATFNFTVSGDFQQRYNTVRFAREFITTGVLSINGSVVLRVAMGDDNRDQVKRLDESLQVYEPIIETLDAFGITAKWDPSRMSEKEVRDLGFMHQLFIEKKPLVGQKLESPLVHFDIQGARVYAIAKEQSDGSYEFVDLQSEELFFVIGWPDEKASSVEAGFDPVPPIVAIGETGFKKIVNLDPDKLSTAFSRFPVTEGNQSPLNQKLLEMLSAYDSGCQQPDALLACASVLAKKLYEFNPESDIYSLNMMQTIRRKRTFEPDEKKLLQNMAIDSETPYARAAAYALLGDQDMASNLLERCEPEERKQILDYPIALFFESNDQGALFL